MPNVAQDEIEVALDRLGAVDEKSQFHENFANAAFDIGQAEIVRRKWASSAARLAPMLSCISAERFDARDADFTTSIWVRWRIFSRLE
jgi:hypothetical protein